jgi:hypothetical protein
MVPIGDFSSVSTKRGQATLLVEDAAIGGLLHRIVDLDERSDGPCG